MIVETKSSTQQGSDEKAWLKILAKYRTPHTGRSVFELTITAIPFAALWTLT
jgi:omega-6 fatty acid desaturase (delta-12 desaturase)